MGRLVKETDERLKEITEAIQYDSGTGLFRRIGKAGHNSKKGWFSGTLMSRGYRKIGIGYTEHLAHRIAWAIHYGSWPENGVDHIDGDCGNNRIKNLREANQTENLRNARLSRKNTTGVCGVYFAKNRTTNKWFAKIRSGGKNIYLGYFETKEEAISVRKQAEKEHGYHKNHGRPR